MQRIFGISAPKKAFSLVEIMVSLVILSLLAAGLLSVFNASSRLVDRSKRRLLAMDIARQEIEAKRQYIRADLWNNASNPLNPTGTWFVCNSTNYPGYTVECRVDNVTGAEYRKMSVRVRW